MEQTIVHFEIPADQPERAANFYRELFGWDIKQFEGSVAGGMEYWMVRTVPTDGQGRPTVPGVNGGLMRRMYPISPWCTTSTSRAWTSRSAERSSLVPRS